MLVYAIMFVKRGKRVTPLMGAFLNLMIKVNLQDV
jgi:type IV secretory pathway TraG/TraD family ATPase VirD4